MGYINSVSKSTGVSRMYLSTSFFTATSLFLPTFFLFVRIVQGASNVTLPTEQATDKIGDVVYPKIKVNASAPLTLKCEFKTTAPAIISTVTWRHNGKLLQKGEEYDMVIEKHGPLYLAFLTLKKPGNFLFFTLLEMVKINVFCLLVSPHRAAVVGQI